MTNISDTQLCWAVENYLQGQGRKSRAHLVKIVKSGVDLNHIDLPYTSTPLHRAGGNAAPDLRAFTQPPTAATDGLERSLLHHAASRCRIDFACGIIMLFMHKSNL